MFYHDENGFTYVRYTEGKRPLKLCTYWIDSPESDAYLDTIIAFVIAAANKPVHIAKMQPVKFWQLVERLATLFCRAYSPTREKGVSKPEIRGAIYYVLNAALQAGDWPAEYVITKQTFVQYGGDYNSREKLCSDQD
ncbi:hypothetical protein [Paenibacillus naphthalenovorans]|uniref:hypothetical protein n=1 Tax=Paenibacillus naphthalenovorans TaxID=162209 RepID=UPI003D281902